MLCFRTHQRVQHLVHRRSQGTSGCGGHHSIGTGRSAHEVGSRAAPVAAGSNGFGAPAQGDSQEEIHDDYGVLVKNMSGFLRTRRQYTTARQLRSFPEAQPMERFSTMNSAPLRSRLRYATDLLIQITRVTHRNVFRMETNLSFVLRTRALTRDDRCRHLQKSNKACA